MQFRNKNKFRFRVLLLYSIYKSAKTKHILISVLHFSHINKYMGT